jgi:hypothetical protein
VSDHKISFPLFPYHFNSKGSNDEYLVEKADESGNKRRYVCGVASGMQIDKHGERLTKNAIQSMMNQANTGDILLYPDIHGIKDNEDIGILSKQEMLPNGDWKVDFRLYDEYDQLGEDVVIKNEKLWKKLNGFPPYTKRRQKGFSIEGYVPEKDIMGKDGDRRVINDVILDGVVLVPKPAYNSVVEAAYKCLGELSPKVENKVRKEFKSTLSELVNQKETENKYYTKKYEIENALEDAVKDIMSDKWENKRERLEIVFEEFKSMVIDLIINSSDIFQEEEIDDVEGITKSKKIEGLLLEIQKSGKAVLNKIKEVNKNE